MIANRGQILPPALVFILLMACFWVMILNVGKLVKDRIQLQIAADTAAQSACAIRARALSSIGRMNGWLGTPELGIGMPKTAWWPDAALWQQQFIRMVQFLQLAYDRAYGGGGAAQLVGRIARRQGADGLYSPKGSYSLRLQINHGPIWYLRTVHIYGVPVPMLPPEIRDDRPETRRWYEQGPDFAKKSMRVYLYRRAGSPLNGTFPLGRRLFDIRMPDLYAVAAARVYNRRGPMFPPRSSAEGIFAGVKALTAYAQAEEHWRSQLVPVGESYAH